MTDLMASRTRTSQPDVTAATITEDVLQQPAAPAPAAAVAGVAEPVPVRAGAPVSDEAPPVSAPESGGPVDPGATPVDDTTVAGVLPRPGPQPVGPPGFASMFAKRDPGNRRERRAAAKAAHRAVKK